MQNKQRFCLYKKKKMLVACKQQRLWQVHNIQHGDQKDP